MGTNEGQKGRQKRETYGERQKVRHRRRASAEETVGKPGEGIHWDGGGTEGGGRSEWRRCILFI